MFVWVLHSLFFLLFSDSKNCFVNDVEMCTSLLPSIVIHEILIQFHSLIGFRSFSKNKMKVFTLTEYKVENWFAKIF